MDLREFKNAIDSLIGLVSSEAEARVEGNDPDADYLHRRALKKRDQIIEAFKDEMSRR